MSSAMPVPHFTPESAPLSGRYRHYKGQHYLVLHLARHSETGEELVVYQQLYGDGSIWVRPRAMFLDTITHNGVSQPRFAYLGPTTDGAHS